MKKILNEYLEADLDNLNGRIIDGPSLGQQDLHVLSQLRGQILVFQKILDLKEFLLELTEDEVNNAT